MIKYAWYRSCLEYLQRRLKSNLSFVRHANDSLIISITFVIYVSEVVTHNICKFYAAHTLCEHKYSTFIFGFERITLFATCFRICYCHASKYRIPFPIFMQIVQHIPILYSKLMCGWTFRPISFIYPKAMILRRRNFTSLPMDLYTNNLMINN